jgi:hypothetical protein
VQIAHGGAHGESADYMHEEVGNVRLVFDRRDPAVCALVLPPFSFHRRFFCFSTKMRFSLRFQFADDIRKSRRLSMRDKGPNLAVSFATDDNDSVHSLNAHVLRPSGSRLMNRMR